MRPQDCPSSLVSVHVDAVSTGHPDQRPPPVLREEMGSGDHGASPHPAQVPVCMCGLECDLRDV